MTNHNTTHHLCKYSDSAWPGTRTLEERMGHSYVEGTLVTRKLRHTEEMGYHLRQLAQIVSIIRGPLPSDAADSRDAFGPRGRLLVRQVLWILQFTSFAEMKAQQVRCMADVRMKKVRRKWPGSTCRCARHNPPAFDAQLFRERSEICIQRRGDVPLVDHQSLPSNLEKRRDTINTFTSFTGASRDTDAVSARASTNCPCM
jgi:hypothetical protein